MNFEQYSQIHKTAGKAAASEALKAASIEKHEGDKPCYKTPKQGLHNVDFNQSFDVVFGKK